MKRRFLHPLFCTLLLSSLALAQDLVSFEKQVTVKKLANGLTVIICERPEAPVFSFFTHVDAGSAQDPRGATGMAHMFEHMAFKGTDTIGTKDYAAEKVALQRLNRLRRLSSTNGTAALVTTMPKPKTWKKPGRTR